MYKYFIVLIFCMPVFFSLKLGEFVPADLSRFVIGQSTHLHAGYMLRLLSFFFAVFRLVNNAG